MTMVFYCPIIFMTSVFMFKTFLSNAADFSYFQTIPAAGLLMESFSFF